MSGEALDALRQVLWATASILGALSIIAGAIYTIVRFLFPGVVTGIRTALKNFDAASRVVHAELAINGGGTLLDKVGKIEPRFDQLDERLGKIEGRVKTLPCTEQGSCPGAALLAKLTAGTGDR